jgi:hypothetical protein
MLAYPISSDSQLRLFWNHTDPEKVGAFGEFVKWVLPDGQNYAPALYSGKNRVEP